MDFPQQLEACVKQANQALSRFIAPLPFQNTPVVETMQYGALLGGKRLRPFLVYATGHMFGVSTNTLDANAILAGDALQTLAFSILSDADMPEVSDRDRISMISELASASGIAGMCGGQALDLDAEGKHVPLDALERIHRHKTGALIRAAVRLGALSAGDKGRRALPVLDKYAESIGLAFQVQDDILDVVGDTATLGKRQGADQQLGKSTYPALLGLEQARKKARDLIDDARQSLKQLTEQSLDTSALEALADYIIQRNK